MRIEELATLLAGTHPRWDEEMYDKQLDQFNLDPEKKVRHLSQGQRAQLKLILAVACRPDLLVMDDPMLGVIRP